MQPRPHLQRRGPGGSKTGLARALSKLGFCSRSQAWALIQAGRVRLDGAIVRDPERGVDWQHDRIEVDGQSVRAEARLYLMLNKPRGLVTTASDEQGRETAYACLAGCRVSDWGGRSKIGAREDVRLPGAKVRAVPSQPRRGGDIAPRVPRVFPVGRLDKASEGLLLFTNDTAWAAAVTDPESHLDKTYHVQVDCLADETLVRRITEGIRVEGELLLAKRVGVLRHGVKNSWLEVVLDEGKNRHIRRLLGALGVNVLRLVRVAIGPLQLGTLAKGDSRPLTRKEVRALAKPSPEEGAV